MIFADCGPQPLGLYPLVADFSRLQKLIDLGISTIQLRIKDAAPATIEKAIRQSVDYARERNVRLFINDYWSLALRYGAYGVHIGQEDLASCDLAALAKGGLRLGISTHNDVEWMQAAALRPSYIAYGPVFPTHSKVVNHSPQGLDCLSQRVAATDLPVVAIGGINLSNAAEVKACGVSGIAVIAALATTNDLAAQVRQWLNLWR